MGTIYVQNRQLDVDVTEELEFYEWDNVRWRSDKLVASSPFRYDRHPSFFVNLNETSAYYGYWKDSGAYDAEYSSGNFVKLLSFLRDETYNETEEYLLFKYGELTEEGEIKLPRLRLPSNKQEKPVVLPESKLEGLKLPLMSYLSNRGISEEVQKKFQVRYDPESKTVILPWRRADGSLANLKYRKINSKIFWYEKGGAPTQNLIYGIDQVYKNRYDYVVVTEAEIDALSFWTAGIPAVALGGTALSRYKINILIKIPVSALYIATDNDKPGERLRYEFKRSVSAFKRVCDVYIPPDYKDANEALVSGVDLKELVDKCRTKILEKQTLVQL